jgi:PncC family amidohydrolase
LTVFPRSMKPEREIGALLTRLGLTLATAESCTGGLISHRITNVPGSSNYFERGFIVYSNRSKAELLGIAPDLIRSHGAVSREVAEAMAIGASKASGADYTLSVTGIAGPISDESKKPVGLVYIAVRAPDRAVRVKKYNFRGTRLQVKRQSADAALRLLLEAIG